MTKKRVLIYFITTSLSIFGLLIVFFLNDYFYLTLFVPLIFYCVYRTSLRVFVKKNSRLPLDTVFDMSWGNWPDRLFSIGVFLFGLWLSFLSVMLLADNIVNEGLFNLVKSKKTEYRTVSSDTFTVAKCTFVDGKIVKGTAIIEKGSGKDLVNKFFRVNYNSSDIRESVLLVNEEVTDFNIIKAAGFK